MTTFELMIKGEVYKFIKAMTTVERTVDLCHGLSVVIINFFKQVGEMVGVRWLIVIIVLCHVIFRHLVIAAA